MLIDARYELIDMDNVDDTDEVLVTGMEFKNWTKHLIEDESTEKDKILEGISDLQKTLNKFEKSLGESIRKLQYLNKKSFEDLHETVESAKLSFEQSPYTNTCGSNSISKWQEEQIDKMMEYFK